MQLTSLPVGIKQCSLALNGRKENMQAAEETLAVMAQTKPEMGYVKRAIAAIRKFLRGLGVNLKVSDNDIIANYILPARALIERGTGQGSTKFAKLNSNSSQMMKMQNLHTTTKSESENSASTLPSYSVLPSQMPMEPIHQFRCLKGVISEQLLLRSGKPPLDTDLPPF
jgi:alcohol dehydrogenase YqhD (iron-dependent ADH family)